MSTIVSPSLLAADFLHLEREIDMINRSEAEWLHLDVMDGVFVLGAMMMNVHYEACVHLHRTIHQIHEEGMKAGVTLNPSTPVSVLEDIIQDVDMVLLMSVNPGFGGQTFIEHTLEKTRKLRQLIERTGSKALIEVDGGVQADTAPRLVEAGVDVLVSGSYVFKNAAPLAAIKSLHDLSR